MPCYYKNREKAYAKAAEVKAETGFMPEVYSVSQPNGIKVFVVPMPKKVSGKQFGKSLGLGFGKQGIPSAGLGSLVFPSRKSKLERLKEKEAELKQQAANWKAEAEAKRLRELYGKKSLVERAKGFLEKKKSIYD